MLHLLELLQMLRLLLGPARLLPQLSPEPLGLSIPKEHRSTRARLTVPLSAARSPQQGRGGLLPLFPRCARRLWCETSRLLRSHDFLGGPGARPVPM